MSGSDPVHDRLEPYKYRVYKNLDPHGVHDLCDFFVLDLQHDMAALPALEAYADAIRSRQPELAKDLDALLEKKFCNCIDLNHPADGCPIHKGRKK